MSIVPVKYDVIKYVLYSRYARSSNVSDLLQKLQQLSTESVHLLAEDQCDVIVGSDVARISGYFDMFEPYEIPTEEFINLVKEWLDFLLSYERGDIPGIIPTNKMNELVIVPRHAVNKDFWK